ncbi:MAG: rod shape-determining protein RodA [Flavobacteriales bacterium]|jgi:hypothetical protein|nr:rod shape-determining protein RodA [Flavobacteriales bacterium]|tara:strand:- start:235 stop:657 length:423 start_codon:yes stop_codon:yes gene_type:complete
MRLTLLLIPLFIFSCKQKTDADTILASTSVNEKVFFKNIKNGDTLTSPFIVEMGVVGMKIKPAGELEAGTGHHHIIIDKGYMDYGQIIPMDKQHLHYGKGDTVVEISLPEGNHMLTMQFANGMHMSYGEQFSTSINIFVK